MIESLRMSESIFTAPWYPWYPRDVLLSERVELMSLAEEAGYRRALDKAWEKGSIPADPVQCARTIGKRCTVAIAKVVLQMFEPMPGDPSRMINARLEGVRAEQKERYLKNAARAKTAADKRWGKDAPSIPQAMRDECHSDSDTEFLTELESETREAPFVETVMDGIRKELGIHFLSNESTWFIEIELAQKNGFTVEHCIETYQLMHAQKWRDGPIKPGTWSENLPILHKLRTEAERKYESNQRNSKPTSLDRIESTKRVIDKYPTEAELAALSREN